MKKDEMVWMQTASGRRMDLLNPFTADVDWEDVAHQLAHVNRFNGATRVSYSVAEHSCLIYDYLVEQGEKDKTCLLGLLHDAHEAYIGDIVTPVQNAIVAIAAHKALNAAAYASKMTKRVDPDVRTPPPEFIAQTVGMATRAAFGEIKNRLDAVIFEAAGLDYTNPAVADEALKIVKSADVSAMMAERDALHSEPPEPWGDLENIAPLAIEPTGWSADRAKGEFMSRLVQCVAFKPMNKSAAA